VRGKGEGKAGRQFADGGRRVEGLRRGSPSRSVQSRRKTAREREDHSRERNATGAEECVVIHVQS